MALAYLIDPENQFMTKSGTINVDGSLRVFDAATDDPVVTYKDFVGTENQERIRLDNNGRAVVIADADRAYRLEVYDRYGTLMWTTTPLWCLATGGGVIGSQYDVLSTDGTVLVSRYNDGGVIKFDLSTALTNEVANWGATMGLLSSVTGGEGWIQVPVVSSAGSVQWENGWVATKDCCADIAASLEMVSGDSDAIYTLDVMCSFLVDGTAVNTEYGLIDPSESTGRVSFEWKGEVTKDQKVECRIFVRSGETMTPGLSAKVYYNEECDGIIGGNADYTAGDFVEITDDKVINVTGVQPASAMTGYVQQSAFEECCSSMSGYISSLSSTVSSVQVDISSISSTVSGLTGTYVEISSISGYSSIWNSASAVSSKLDESAFTAYTATATAGEFSGVTTDSTLTGNGKPGSALGVNARELVFDSSMNTSISGNSAIVGVGSAITSGFIPTSESGNFILTSQSGAFQPSGNYASSTDLTGYVEVSSISGASSTWNSASAISSKLDESAFTAYTATATAGGFSGVTTDTSLTGDGTTGSALGVNTDILSAYMPESASGDFILTSQSGAFQPSGNYVSSTDMSGYIPTSESANYILTSQSGAFQPSGNYVSSSDMSGYVEASSISAASSVWNSASAVSSLMPWSALEGDGISITAISGSAIGGTSTGGKTYSGIAPVVVDNTADTISVQGRELVFESPLSTSESGTSAVVGIDLTPYQTTAGMTAYQPSGDYIYASSLGTGNI